MGMFIGQLNHPLNHLTKGRLSDQTCPYLNYSPRLTLEPAETNRLFQGTARDQYSSSADWSSPANAGLPPLTQKGAEGDCLIHGCLPQGTSIPMPPSPAAEQPSCNCRNNPTSTLLWTLHALRTCWISPEASAKMAVMCIYMNHIH